MPKITKTTKKLGPQPTHHYKPSDLQRQSDIYRALAIDLMRMIDRNIRTISDLRKCGLATKKFRKEYLVSLKKINLQTKINITNLFNQFFNLK